MFWAKIQIIYVKSKVYQKTNFVHAVAAQSKFINICFLSVVI